MNLADAVRSLAALVPSDTTSHAAIRAALPAIIASDSTIARVVSGHQVYRLATLVQHFRVTAARQAARAARPEPRPAAPGVLPREACPRCSRSIAVMPADLDGKPRVRPHNCDHGYQCGFVRCPKCEADRAAKLSTTATVQRPSDGVLAIVMSRRAAERLPGLSVGQVRDAGGDLVAVAVPASDADLLLMGQRLVRVKVKRRPQRAPALM